MKFTEYAAGKFMATNAPIEVDIIVCFDADVSYMVQTANQSYTFETWDKAVRFAEHAYGVRGVFAEDFVDEDAHYDAMFLRDSDGYATLGGQV